jgi:hypothetical protein
MRDAKICAVVFAVTVGSTAWAQAPAARVDFHLPNIGCLSNLGGKFDEEVVGQIRHGFKPFFHDVDVLSECAGGTGPDGRQQYGVWEHTGDANEESARRALLKTLPTIRIKKPAGNTEDFAASYSASLISTAINNKLNQTKATPINGAGMGSSSWCCDIWVGNITINSWDPVSLTAPNQVGLTVHGSVQIEITPPGFGYFPYDIDFNILDTFALLRKPTKPTKSCGNDNGVIACSTQGSYDVPDAFTSGNTTALPSIGCPFARALPVTQPIPGGQKLVFDYDRDRVDGNGISAGATIRQCAREASARLGGPNVINIAAGQTSGGTSISLTTSDMRPPLTVTIEGHVETINGTSGSVGVTAHSTSSSAPTEIGVKAHVVDADNLSADATTTVVVYTAAYLKQLQQRPCISKPYLPNCK